MSDRGERAQRRGEWLTGPSLPDGDWQGRRLGMPQSGVGSTGSLLRRVGGIAVDWAIVVVVVRLAMSGDAMAQNWVIQGSFIALYFLSVWLLGRSPGHALMGIAVVDVRTKQTLASTGPVGALRAFVRVLLVCLILPVVIMDPDGRGLHDKASGAVVVRTR